MRPGSTDGELLVDRVRFIKQSTHTEVLLFVFISVHAGGSDFPHPHAGRRRAGSDTAPGHMLHHQVFEERLHLIGRHVKAQTGSFLVFFLPINCTQRRISPEINTFSCARHSPRLRVSNYGSSRVCAAQDSFTQCRAQELCCNRYSQGKLLRLSYSTPHKCKSALSFSPYAVRISLPVKESQFHVTTIHSYTAVLLDSYSILHLCLFVKSQYFLPESILCCFFVFPNPRLDWCINW